MQCWHCKKEIDLEKCNFCPHCGSSVSCRKTLLFFQKILNSEKKIKIILLLEVFFLSGVIFGFARYYYQAGQENKRIAEMIKENDGVQVVVRSKEEVMPVTYVGENKRLVELRVTSDIYGKIRTEVEVPGFINKETEIFDIRPESKIYYLDPDISEVGYGSLADSHEAELFIKAYLIRDGSEEELISDQKKIKFFSRGSIIWNDGEADNSKYIVRLINKDKEEIKELVRKAAGHMREVGGQTDSMVGILGDEAETKRQLKAIFLAIQKDYDVQYVMAPFSYDNVNIQQIKTPEEVLRTKSGSCVELSLLVAAALENIGLNSVLVLTKGHAWVGVELGPRSNKFIFIESTALEMTPDQAINFAQKEWDYIKDSLSYRLLRTNELRADGILPIRY